MLFQNISYSIFDVFNFIYWIWYETHKSHHYFVVLQYISYKDKELNHIWFNSLNHMCDIRRRIYDYFLSTSLRIFSIICSYFVLNKYDVFPPPGFPKRCKWLQGMDQILLLAPLWSLKITIIRIFYLLSMASKWQSSSKWFNNCDNPVYYILPIKKFLKLLHKTFVRSSSSASSCI